MALNDIKLSDQLITEWYKEILVPSQNSNVGEFAAITSKPVAPPPPATQFSVVKHLGSNRRNITIIVESPASPFLPDDQLAVLTKILEACQLNLADVAIVNHATTPVAIAEIRGQLQPKTILLFGPEPSAIKLPINFPVFKPIDYDAVKFLAAPGLVQFVANTEESKLLKSKLWVCLKTIFEV